MKRFGFCLPQRFLLYAFLLLLFGSLLLSQGAISAYAASKTVSPHERGIVPNVTCTTTPNYTINAFYGSFIGTVVLRVGWENAQQTSGFGYCHIVAEHGLYPLSFISYVLTYGHATGGTATSITIQCVYPGDWKNHTVVVITSPILSDGYSKGILTAY